MTVNKNGKLEFHPIEQLIPYARNARTHTEGQIAQIAASIREFGFNGAILIDAEGSILAGHGRVLAARLLGMTELPAMVVEHLSDNQKRAFRLADNKLGVNAGWDDEMLRLELEALAEQDIDLNLTGFDDLELRQALAQITSEPLTDENEVPDCKGPTVTVAGDLWVLGRHRVLCGDGTNDQNLQGVLNGRRSDMVFTDLPYNVDYTGKTKQNLKIANDNLGEAFRSFVFSACRALLSVNNGAVYICMSSGELHTLYQAFTEAGGHWSTYIIWAKNTFTLGRSDYQRQFEPLLYGWSEGQKHFWCGKRDQGDVWSVDKPFRNDVHPTMKPVELVETAIGNSSHPGDAVLDPFAGSGSTLIACERTGRDACLLEIEPRYVDVIVRRWETYTGNTASRERDGKTFEELATLTRNGHEGTAK